MSPGYDQNESLKMDELSEIKREIGSLRGDVTSILNLLKGTDLQEGNGLIHTVQKLKKNQDNHFKAIGIVSGIGFIFGGIATWLLKVIGLLK